MTVLRRALLACVLVVLVLPAGAAAQDSLTLGRAIELAQGEGRAGVAARATRDAARFRDDAFGARFLPQLSIGGTVPRYNRAIIPVLQPDGTTLFRSQNQTEAELSATITQRLPTGGDFFVSSSLATLQVSGTETLRTWSSTPVSFGIRQELFRPNTYALDRREQPVRNEVAERGYFEAMENIALDVTSKFFDAYSARSTLANAETNAAVNDTLYRLNEGRYQVGKIGENDLLQSELALLRARTSVDGARLEYDRAMAALRLALDLPVDAPVELVVPVQVPEFTIDTALAVSQALANRSTVSQVRLQALQARRAVGAARLENGFGATVQASLGFNATASEFDFAYRNLLEARQATISVEIPLIQWGARSGEIRAAEAELERTESEGELALAQVQQEAHFAARQLLQARRGLALSAKADTVAAKRFEVAYNRYVIGRIDIDNLYVAQAEKDQALNQYVQALRAHWLAYYRLRQLTLYDFDAGHPIR
ncbi:MAG TPA: TolC family protein [Gemmatimonadales bacterium]|nr:TolC family protein [Gemmatimonadales bacterium]